MSDIDFDGASYEWRLNKKSVGTGYFKYKCSYVHSNGKPCTHVIDSDNKGTKCGRHLHR
jgi:hypothetical protein